MQVVIHYAYSAVMVLVNLGPKQHFMPAGKLGLVNWSIFVQVGQNAGTLLFSNLTLDVINDCIPHCATTI